MKALGLETRCYAIDTWKGDEHAGYYGEEVFQVVQDYNERHYTAFSRLIRSTFDDALTHFSDASIDLLHIDGRHFYEDVKHDFETWRPKLSARSVVVFHDTNVRERNFAVFRLWEELRAEFPSFEFLHGHGLGVLGYGSALPEDIKVFFEATSDSHMAAEVRGAYGRLGGALRADFTQRQTYAQVTANLKEQEVRAGDLETKLDEAVAERDGQIAGLNEAVAERDGQIAGLNEAVAERDGQIAGLNEAVEQDDNIAGAFGRHVAYKEADPYTKRDIENHMNSFLQHPLVVSKDTDPEKYESDLQWRQFLHFYSDNNSCMRRSIWEKIPYPDVDFAEDQVWAQQIIDEGYAKAYAPTAVVYHSHDFGLWEKLQRSFDDAKYFKMQFGYRGCSTIKEWARTILGISYLDLKYAMNCMECDINWRHDIRKPIDNFMALTGRFLGTHYKKIPDAIQLRLSRDRKVFMGR